MYRYSLRNANEFHLPMQKGGLGSRQLSGIRFFFGGSFIAWTPSWTRFQPLIQSLAGVARLARKSSAADCTPARESLGYLEYTDSGIPATRRWNC